jgi:RHS repeat-associated protein
MRTGTGTGTSGLKRLFDDHASTTLSTSLGSTAITADGATGAKLSELRYKPWGEIRYASQPTMTDRRYTGQRMEGIGLYDYGARWFDASSGRFVQADTIVPNLGDPQALDRYAAMNNNPVKFVDPTGHMVDQSGGGGAFSMGEEWWKKRQDKTPQPPKRPTNPSLDGINNQPNKEGTGPITDFMLQLPGSAENWSNLATGIDMMAWLTDIYAAGVVTYAGIAGAALPSPLIAAGLPEVPVATGLAGMALAELYIQPMLFTGNTLATISMGATLVADTKGGNTRIEEAKFSSNTANSMALTDVGWLSNEAYLSLTIQSIAVANDLQWTSLPFPVFP